MSLPPWTTSGYDGLAPWRRKPRSKTVLPRRTATRCQHGTPTTEPCYPCDIGHPDEWYAKPRCPHGRCNLPADHVGDCSPR